MMWNSAVEASYYYGEGKVTKVGPDEYDGDPYTYVDGCTTALLRTGVDGPHAGLADRLCNLNGRLYE